MTHLGRFLRNTKPEAHIHLCGQEEPSGVPEGVIVSPGSYQTTFVKGPPPRNGSKYVKNEGFLMPFKWGCGGQKVPDDGL